MATRIQIRHVSGSKANQVEEFQLDNLDELTMGRDPRSTVAFDSTRDDRVSRKHATIRISKGDQVSFYISDVGSANGTKVNGVKVERETELLPEDTVELGAGGPVFTFDVQPRPSHLAVGRTKIIGQTSNAPGFVPPMTRIDTGIIPPPTATGQNFGPTRVGVGRETVQRMLGEERQATSRKWMYTLAAVLVLVALGGSGLYYKTTVDKQIALDQVARATEAANAAKLEAAKKLAMVEEQNQNNKRELVKAIGISPAEVVSKWGNSTVWIDVQWRLYDRETLKPLFQKAFYLESGEKLPAYIKVGPGKIVRWLTTDDEERKNYSIGAAARGTGFVISKDGFILTNKHVAAGWMINFNQFSPYEEGRGVIVDIQRQPLKKEQTPKVFDLSPQLADFKDLLKWQPDEGGMIFQSRQPIPIQDSDRAFTGKNEVLAVRFPASRSSINADLVRPSTDADIALIKISTPQPLTAVELANDDHVVLGGAITVLGYPGASAETIAVIKTTEAGDLHSRVEQVPEPTVTPGNISRLSRGLEQIGSLTVMGTMGETYQLTASASAGNSGGPVFDSDGKVIAVFTYGSRRETMTLAVPIHYGKDLSAVQQ